METSQNELEEIPEILQNTGLAVEDLKEILSLGRFYVDEVMDILWPFSRTEKYRVN